MPSDHAYVWKWVAGLLSAFLLGLVSVGIPAAVKALDAPSKSDYEDLRREIVASQVQLARVEERLVVLQAFVYERVR